MARTKVERRVEEDVTALEKEMKSLTAKASRIMDLLIDAEIDKDTFLSRLSAINTQKEKISAQIEKVKIVKVDRSELVFAQARNMVKDYFKAEIQEKRKILTALIKKITVYSDGSINIEWRF